MSKKKLFIITIILLVIIVIILKILVFSRLFKTRDGNSNSQYFLNKIENVDDSKDKVLYDGILFFDNGKDKIKIYIKTAQTDFERQKGLMYKNSLPDSSGMLFIFDEEDFHTFWMKNTYISLDIIFVDSKNKIVKIHKYTQPLSEKGLSSEGKAKYVIEVNAGFCDKYQIKEGDIIDYKLF